MLKILTVCALFCVACTASPASPVALKVRAEATIGELNVRPPDMIRIKAGSYVREISGGGLVFVFVDARQNENAGS